MIKCRLAVTSCVLMVTNPNPQCQLTAGTFPVASMLCGQAQQGSFTRVFQTLILPLCQPEVTVVPNHQQVPNNICARRQAKDLLLIISFDKPLWQLSLLCPLTDRRLRLGEIKSLLRRLRGW